MNQERLEQALQYGGARSEAAKEVVRKIAAALPEFSVFWRYPEDDEEDGLGNVHFYDGNIMVKIVDFRRFDENE